MTNLELVAFCKKALEKKTVYCWGTYGKVLTKNLLDDKRKQYPSRYSDTRYNYLRQLMAADTYYGCDCAGLIKWFLWTNGNIDGAIKYNGNTDRGTNGLWDAAKVKGSNMKTMPEKPGLIVWKSGHVGVYIGKKRVIECTLGSRGDGVVETSLDETGWTRWLQLPEIDYKDDDTVVDQRAFQTTTTPVQTQTSQTPVTTPVQPQITEQTQTQSYINRLTPFQNDPAIKRIIESLKKRLNLK